LKPTHPFVDTGEEGRSEVRKLGVGFARLVLFGGFSKILDICRSNIEKFENNVDNLRLASPWLDKG
jgi:hypothetical protein